MAKTVLGLDVGSKYIKYTELLHIDKNRYQLISVGMCPGPVKGLNSEASIDHEALGVTIKKLLKDGGVRSKMVNVALPEANVFTRIIQVPPLSERELASAIKWEAEQYIPLPLEEVEMDFSIVGESKDKDGNKKLDVLLVAAPKMLIDRFTKVLEAADLEAEAMETEIISASRALLPPVFDKPLTVMVVNIGGQSTDLSIIRQGVIAFTRSLPTGGTTFTKAIAQDLGFPIPQAEEYKKAYGLKSDQIEGKIYRTLKPIFSVIVDEIKRSITFFQNKFSEEVMAALIISGGSARLPGLVEALTEAVGIETQIGNPWTRVAKDQSRFAKLDEEGCTFVVACGLAMRE